MAVIAEKEDKPLSAPNGTSKIAPNGMESGVKDLYQGPEDSQGRYTWTDKYPEDLEKAAEDEVTARYAILVRHKKCYDDSRKTLEIHSIVVQSPLIKKVLGVVLADYPGVTTSLARLTFEAPFKPFVHRWEKLTKAINEQQDQLAKEHLLLLYRVLKEELKETIAVKDDFIANGVITYKHLWTIFPPGCTVLTAEDGRDSAVKFGDGSYINHARYGPCFQLSCQKVDWDGEKFGYANDTSLISGFAGTKPITELEVFPLDFHPNCAAITERLLARGKLFERYQGYHYKAYDGIAIARTQCGPVKVNVESRIIIDCYAYGRFNPNQGMYLQSLTHSVRSTFSYRDNDDSDSESYDEDYEVEIDGDSGRDVPKEKGMRRIPLTKEQLILCTPLIRGYALKMKRWLQFFVDSICEIRWNNNAFESLVLPEDQKELILSFAESQILYKQKFDDFVEGKGKGIIMLLSGTPGVGKTLTAESVAEHMHVPLYMMGASDLGTNSSQVENSLSTILEMVAKWNAVLLLDECDVFLEARNANDLERNKLVSIFLRTLEYYEGILFMTTNRVDNIDAAFQSRIHLSMNYPELDKDSRRHIWSNFLSRGVEHELTDANLDELASMDLNGRQIKNILKTSQLLACRKKTALRFEYLNTVLNIEKRGRVST